MNLSRKASELLSLYKIFPKQSLGQNFLIDEDLLKNMVSHASISKDDVVLEVGAGLGFLTRLLAEKCRKVIAVEIDHRLVGFLKNELKDFSNVDLLQGNILKVSVPLFNKVVSTPPYYISSPLVSWLFRHNFDCAVLTFQKEFAERLTAPIGNKDYGWLTVITYYWAEVELLDFVPKTLFYPSPEVDSYVVRLKYRKTKPFHVEDFKIFHELVKTLFSQRNKKVRNGISLFLRKLGKERTEALRIADSCPFRDKRVRELAPEDFGAIANELVP
jgi:16S rRNA (adenine1518-N6/adenine1519-N6)-dimethyltransferase